MTSNIFTKNCSVSLFEKHGSKLYGEDSYYNNYVNKISNKMNDKKEEDFAQENVEKDQSVILIN